MIYSAQSQEFARKVAEKCDRQKVGFVDVIVIGLVISSLNLLVNCIRMVYQIRSGQEHQKLKELCSTEKGRDYEIRKAARVLRHQAKQEGRKLSKTGSYEIAEKTVDEAISTPEEVAGGFCRSVMSEPMGSLAFLNEDETEEEEQ